MAPTILTDDESELRETRRSVGTSVISYVGRMSTNDDRSSSSSRKNTNKKSLKGIRKRTTERVEYNKLGTILSGILDLKDNTRDNNCDDNSINNNNNNNNQNGIINDNDNNNNITTSNRLITVDNNLLQLQYNGQYNDETKENFITLEDDNSNSSNNNSNYINNDNDGIEECPLHVISGDVIMIDKTDGISYKNCSCKCIEYFMNNNRNTVPRTIIVKNKEEKSLGNITMKSIKLMRRVQCLILKCNQFKFDIEPLITAILAKPKIEPLQIHSIDIESTVIVRNPTQSIQLTK